MELSQVNSLNINSMSQINSAQTRNVENIDKSSNDQQPKVDKIELSEPSNKVQSSFSSNIVSNMDKISQLQQQQSNVNSQIDTLSKITQATTQVIEAPKKGQVLDDIQPEIQSLMNNFNSASTQMKTSQSSSSASRAYFDGIVGAIPLSGEEIYQAVKLQQERLEHVSKKIENETNNIVSQSKESIEAEKKPEFKNFNFEKESVEFNSQSLKLVEGPIVPTQANAQTEHNINLLAS
ncbi:MAG: hypothetical protein U9N59_04810 [Campylobacterota bacterium]|nr:hypothetical protein [Campylobacterota bacterium]